MYNYRSVLIGRWSWLLLLAVALAGCGGGSQRASANQTPSEYLSGALDWVEEHAIVRDKVDWPAVRREALAQAANAHTIAETYPAIRSALQKLGDAGDKNASLLDPGQLGAGQTQFGLHTIMPEGLVVSVEAGSPAEQAGVRVADVIETMNGQPLKEAPEVSLVQTGQNRTVRLMLRRPGQDQPIEVTLTPASYGYEGKPAGRRLSVGTNGIGYVELPWDWGSEQYPTIAQRAIRDIDQQPTCGWVIDLRRNMGGNLWTFLAAVGPILGEGDVGGFVYRDGRREAWTYRAGKVLWDGNERGESYVYGQVYHLKQPQPPVALLISKATIQAGELVVAAFQGRPNTGTFGQATGGLPMLTDHTSLSDGAELFVSGAYSQDRTGRTYDGPIQPDQAVATDWLQFGADRDPVLAAAAEWLRAQPACAS